MVDVADVAPERAVLDAASHAEVRPRPGRACDPAAPVTKSPSGPEHPAHVMSACEDEITTSASGGPPSTGLATVTCSAFTVMSARLPLADADCSLIITVTGPTVSLWFGSPLTVIALPSTISPATSELPLALALPAPSHVASAREDSTSAWTVWPAAPRVASATEASARLWLPWATVAAWTTFALRRFPV